MLFEIRVENLLLIEKAELCLTEGVNVLTGETGAGKTILTHALDLLLGGKPRSGIVRPGADEAYVEGIFAIPEGLRGQLGDHLAIDGEEIALARRVSSQGRSRAYVGGRSVTAAQLREISSELVSFYGQHEHRKLTLTSAQLEILDGFCGTKQISTRIEYLAAFNSERDLRAQIEEIKSRIGNRERELDLLNWEIEEIERLDPNPEEEEALTSERNRLRYSERIRSATAAGLEMLTSDSSDGAIQLLNRSAAAVSDAGSIDSSIATLAQRIGSAALELQDIEQELRSYTGELESSPGRLDEVEDRLSTLDRLKRKHGGTVESVLVYADQCRQRRSELEDVEERIEGLTGQHDAVLQRLKTLSAKLHKARKQAGADLTEAVHQRLSQLAMDGAKFEIELSKREGYASTGTDRVEFRIAANPGMPTGPLRDTASGGELSRVMLALMSVASVGGPKTLVFDEIDAGIGGQTARAVATQLQELAKNRQIICITHLPQVAAIADRHFTIVKDAKSETAVTSVTQLDSDGVISELVRMLGSDPEDKTARRLAKELATTV